MRTSVLSVAASTRSSISVGVQIVCMVLVSMHVENASAQAKEWSITHVKGSTELPPCKPIGSPKGEPTGSPKSKMGLMNENVHPFKAENKHSKKPDPGDCKPPKAPVTVFDYVPQIK